MQAKTLECGWFRVLLSALVLLCVLSAATAAASHIHLDGQADAHCSLCMLYATLIAVVVSAGLCLSWRLLVLTKRAEAELPGFVVFRITSIRPPPSPRLCH